MAFKRIHVRGPELTERRQPRVDFPERLRFQPVETTLRVHGRLHEAGVAQHSQVLRDGRLCHPKLTLDFADRLL